MRTSRNDEFQNYQLEEEELLEYSENNAAGLTAILEKDESNYYKVNQQA